MAEVDDIRARLDALSAGKKIDARLDAWLIEKREQNCVALRGACETGRDRALRLEMTRMALNNMRDGRVDREAANVPDALCDHAAKRALAEREFERARRTAEANPGGMVAKLALPLWRDILRDMDWLEAQRQRKRADAEQAALEQRRF